MKTVRFIVEMRVPNDYDINVIVNRTDTELLQSAIEYPDEVKLNEWDYRPCNTDPIMVLRHIKDSVESGCMLDDDDISMIERAIDGFSEDEDDDTLSEFYQDIEGE